jgi:coenzyme Q-binding protein COQ10
MPTHTEQQTLPYTTEQLFDLVAGIERYPEFLPWCRAARIIEKREGGMLAELVISFAHMTERYTSQVTLVRPATANAPGAIDVTMVEGPFDHLVNRWQFTPLENGSRIDFFLDFKFRSRLLEALMGSLFAKATARMVTAFKQRAEALYGKQAL